MFKLDNPFADLPAFDEIRAQQRKAALDMMAVHRQAVDWQMEQAKASYENVRTSMEMARDATQNLGQLWLETFLPAEESKA